MNNITPIYAIVGMFLLIVLVMIIAIVLSPNYKYIICQYDKCYRAESYEKTSDGLRFKYNNKDRILGGAYTIREK
jgi:hypothetical protein